MIATPPVVAMLALHGWVLEPDGGGDAPAKLLERLVTGGLPFALDESGGRRFDPADVINHAVAAGLAGREPCWQAHFVATGQRLAHSVDQVAPDDAWQSARRFRVTFRRQFDLHAYAGRERIRLRLPRPIEDETLTDLVLAVDRLGETAIVAETPGRIEWRLADRPPAELTLGWTADFKSRPGPRGEATLKAVDRATWLAPDEGLVRVTPMVRALAADLAEALGDEAAVARFRDHLIDNFASGVIAYETIIGPATDHVLRTGWYDCQLGSALLVALCRARGIPARIVGGHLLWPAAPTWHVWCEIWLAGEGWSPFDLLAWDLSAGGRDPAWRRIYAGRIDHRMTTQILPHIFAGPMSVPYPAAHIRLSSKEAAGITIDHRAVADGTRIYRDTISVTAYPPDQA